MKMILGKIFESNNHGLRILDTEICVKSAPDPDTVPFESFTFTRKELWELKKLIDKELEEGDRENI